MHSAARSAIALLAFVLLLPTALPQTATETESIRIAELLPNPDVAQGQREFIELHNAGPNRVSLKGWRIEDAATAGGAINAYTFGEVALEAGARIVVWSNGSADARGPAWSTSPSKAVWNDGGDAATLFDGAGNVVDWLAYGTTTAPAPDGFANATRPSAPSRGNSIAWVDGGWNEGSPTPALAPGIVGGFAGATVENVAPAVRLTGPASAKPGEAMQFIANISDENGHDDISTWTVRNGAALVANGTRGGTHPFTLKASTTTGPLVLELRATDAGGLTAISNITVQIRDAKLAVELPPSGGVRFPPLQPGQRNITSLDSFIIRNKGTDAAPVLLDLSAFRGPGRISSEGNVWIGLSNGNETITWQPYEHALQALPTIAPGQAWTVWLRIAQVPTPLPAGNYGTSFTVVTG